MQVRMFPGKHEKGGGHRKVGGELAWMGWEWLAAGAVKRCPVWGVVIVVVWNGIKWNKAPCFVLGC